MPYTLSMALLWVALAVLLGIVIGWLMRSVVAKRQIERARSNHLDTVELERLRARVSELEPVVVERDRLRGDVAAFRSTEAVVAPAAVQAVAAVPTADRDGRHDAETPPREPAPVEPEASIVLDLAAAAMVFGKQIEADDLTVIDGIGPKIAELCDGIGIQTWRDLAQTEVSLLRTMLHDAGPRFRSHDPSTWPEQAALLADGRWADFRALADGLDAGRAVD